jgi:ribosome modulation factor
VDETAVEGAHLRGFIAGIDGLFRSYPHFTDARTLA